ncbi:hypothetical protein UFOVP237_16 [uncultured Caudovirales phage]|uniref:Uncharacterized protein n=1 Tax=uncultured Caudovirales phage TaxID=2100421 RepID=A0A6J7WPG5_9CAUD|nr:hypothetical protein UFOVP237_16 [uncultured Caudovirales phage]
MSIKYGDFSFDASNGYTGSTGKKSVKSYMRGGSATKMAQNVELAKSKAATAFANSKPASKFKTGGKVRHYAEGSNGGVKADNSPTIESIIEDTKGMAIPKDTKKYAPLPTMTPSEAARLKDYQAKEAAKRRYEAETEEMRENPMNKAKGGNVKMARGGGARTVAIRAAPAYKAPKAPGVPAAMATPMAPKPKAPPSLANIAMSRNPQMLKMGGRSKKK